MKNSREVLSSVLKTTQMGQLGIRSVLDTGMEPELRKALEDQLREYDAIETEAHTLATQRGWELQELDSGVRFLTDMTTRMRLRGPETGSKIAAMTIRGNTRGMVKGLHDLHRLVQKDGPVQHLSQRLLDCETANIRQMEPFL